MQTQTLNIALPKTLVKKLDQLAEKEDSNRSELIRAAIRNYLKTQEKWESLFTYGKTVVKSMGIADEESINTIVSDYRHGKRFK